MNYSIFGIYENEESLLTAMRKIIDNKIEIKEVYTPYPIHEVFKILDSKTRISLVTFLFVLLGLAASYTFVYWNSVISYPIVYGGKPLHSIPSFIIVCFISMISVGILLSFITFLIRTRLYPGKKPIIHDVRITDNAFVIQIDKKKSMSDDDLKRIHLLLKENGAIEIIEK